MDKKYSDNELEEIYYRAVKKNQNSKLINKWITKQDSFIKAIERIPNIKNLKILELGSGRGFLTKYLKDKGLDIMGSDFNKFNLKLAKKINNINLDYINALNINYPDNTFDMVISTELIEHLPDVNKHIKEIKRILKLGGYYCFSTPNVYLEKIYNSLTNKKNDPFHISSQSFQSIKKIFKSYGFSIWFIRMEKLTESQEDRLGKIKIIYPVKFLPKILQPSINVIAKLEEK